MGRRNAALGAGGTSSSPRPRDVRGSGSNRFVREESSGSSLVPLSRLAAQTVDRELGSRLAQACCELERTFTVRVLDDTKAGRATWSATSPGTPSKSSVPISSSYR